MEVDLIKNVIESFIGIKPGKWLVRDWIGQTDRPDPIFKTIILSLAKINEKNK